MKIIEKFEYTKSLDWLKCPYCNQRFSTSIKDIEGILQVHLLRHELMKHNVNRT